MSSPDFLPVDWTGQTPPAFDRQKIPAHVALVMDGNGRWANSRGLPRVQGHKAGEAPLPDVVARALPPRVSHLSAYACST